MTKIKEGYKKTEIGVIPIEWEVVKLESVVKKLQSGGTPLSTNLDFYTGDIPFVKIDDITRSGKYLLNTKVAITQEGLDSSSAWLVPINSILYSMYASIGFLSINKIEVSTNQAIMNIIPDSSKITLEFLYQYLLDLKGKIDKYIDQTTQKNLNAQKIKNFKIPLPPLKEQEKIADILSTADEKIDAIAKQIKKAQTLKKGLLQKLLSKGLGHNEFKDSELGKIPVGWEVVELPHITDKITSGGTPSRKKAEYFENGTINWIKTGELRDCYIYNSKEKITEDAIANSSAKVFPVDTLLIAMYGATIGRTAYLKTECSTNQACCAIIFNQNIADPYFYWKYFHFIKDDLISQGRGAGQPNISQAIIKTLFIPLPPLKEQKQIAQILSTADEKIEILRAKKEKYETLKKGLLQKLLSGEIRI